MRRFLATALCVVTVSAFCPSESAAQDETTPRSQFHYGLKGGFDVSTLRGQFANPLLSEVEFEHRYAFTFGGFISWHFNEFIAFQPEFLWVRKSSKAEVSLPELGLSQLIGPKLDYLEIPLLAVFSPPTEGSVDPFIYAGPSFAFNIRAQVESVIDDEYASDDIGNQIEDLDICLAVGGGIVFGEGQMRYNSLRYTLEARLTTGFRDIVIDEEAGDSAGELYNTTFAVMVGVIY